MAKFKIFDVFHISSINQTIIAGDIIDGTISNGMKIEIENYQLIIESIEHIDGSLKDDWISRIGLKVIVDDVAIIAKIQSLLHEGVIIEVTQ